VRHAVRCEHLIVPNFAHSDSRKRDAHIPRRREICARDSMIVWEPLLLSGPFVFRPSLSLGDRKSFPCSSVYCWPPLWLLRYVDGAVSQSGQDASHILKALNFRINLGKDLRKTDRNVHAKQFKGRETGFSLGKQASTYVVTKFYTELVPSSRVANASRK
jgi:hypothetical protein